MVIDLDLGWLDPIWNINKFWVYHLINGRYSEEGEQDEVVSENYIIRMTEILDMFV